MAKLTATILATMAGTATAFAPSASSSAPKTSMALNEFAKGMVGGEGPEPMPFNFGGEKTSRNFDPVGFSEVSLSVSVALGLFICGGGMIEMRELNRRHHCVYNIRRKLYPEFGSRNEMTTS